MDWTTLKKKLESFMGKYKYICLVLTAGLLLMMIPSGDGESAVISDPVPSIPAESIQDQLRQILSKIDGVGKTEVMLTEAAGAETMYQTDEDPGADGAIRRETVIITGESRGQSGLVRTVTPPVYLGAIIVCQGAESPSVRLAVVQAVSSVTGIPSDRITVLKMK